MPLTVVLIDGKAIPVEFTNGDAADMPVPVDNPDTTLESLTPAPRLAEVGTQVETILCGVSSLVRKALQESAPNEWTVEILIGFKGEAGIPFVTKGEANASIKVNAKWTSG
jgi:hypothetical protein